MKNNSTAPVEPITIIFTWHVNNGQDETFRNWLHGVSTEALKFPGHLGVTTLHQEGAASVYQSILRFDTQEHTDAWLHSKERAAWIERLEGIGTQERARLTGLENWFEIPGTTVPPRWKMVIATGIAIYPISLLASIFVQPLLVHQNVFIRSLLFPIVSPAILTYILMPFVTQKLLRRWLYK